MQYSNKIARQLLKHAELRTEVPPGTWLYKQGELLDHYFVIVRGTVKIE